MAGCCAGAGGGPCQLLNVSCLVIPEGAELRCAFVGRFFVVFFGLRGLVDLFTCGRFFGFAGFL